MENKKNKNALLKYFIISSLTCVISFLIGPYKYSIDSIEWLFYVLFLNFMLVLGLLSKNLVFNIFKIRNDDSNVSNKKNDAVIDIKTLKKDQFWVVFIELLSILAFAYWMWETSNIVGAGNLFSGNDSRRALSDSRSNLGKLSELLIGFGVVAFLECNSKDKNKYSKWVKYLSCFTVWLKGITDLSIGARWNMAVVIVLFIFVIKPYKAINNRKKRVFAIIITAVLIIVANTLLELFVVRGVNHGAGRYLISPGDTQMKENWLELYNSTNGAIEGICGLSMYISQPIPVISYVLQNHLPDRLYFGAFLIRPIGIILNFIGIPIMKANEIAKNTFSGLYTGFTYGYIIDWGVYLSPLFIYLTGVLFAKIEKAYYSMEKYYCLYPLCVAMIISCPFYYPWQAGGIDFVLFDLFAFKILKSIKC